MQNARIWVGLAVGLFVATGCASQVDGVEDEDDDSVDESTLALGEAPEPFVGPVPFVGPEAPPAPPVLVASMTKRDVYVLLNGVYARLGFDIAQPIPKNINTKKYWRNRAIKNGLTAENLSALVEGALLALYPAARHIGVYANTTTSQYATCLGPNQTDCITLPTSSTGYGNYPTGTRPRLVFTGLAKAVGFCSRPIMACAGQYAVYLKAGACPTGTNGVRVAYACTESASNMLNLQTLHGLGIVNSSGLYGVE